MATAKDWAAGTTAKAPSSRAILKQVEGELDALRAELTSLENMQGDVDTRIKAAQALVDKFKALDVSARRRMSSVRSRSAGDLQSSILTWWRSASHRLEQFQELKQKHQQEQRGEVGGVHHFGSGTKVGAQRTFGF